MRPANIKDFTLRDLKLQVYVFCPDSICYAQGLDGAIKAVLPEIREQVARGKKLDRVTLKTFPGKPQVPWVVHPLWWSSTPNWDMAPFPWEDPFVSRT